MNGPDETDILAAIVAAADDATAAIDGRRCQRCNSDILSKGCDCRRELEHDTKRGEILEWYKTVEADNPDITDRERAMLERAAMSAMSASRRRQGQAARPEPGTTALKGQMESLRLQRDWGNRRQKWRPGSQDLTNPDLW